MRISNELVAVLCGPHEDGSVSHKRIDLAIAHALKTGLPLLVAGDGNSGLDVEYFADRAREAGVEDVTGLYDPGKCTLTDAISVVTEAQRRFSDSRVCIHLVTDWWHMGRAGLMVLGEARKIELNCVHIKCVCVVGPAPDMHVMLGETQGIRHYLEGCYGEHQAYPPMGKPVCTLAQAATNHPPA